VAEELPPELKVRDLTQIEITTSVHNWLKIADALEKVAHDKWLARETSAKRPEWVFEQQMADQIRQGVADSDPGKRREGEGGRG